jgi:hypothetical protein
MVLVAFTIVKPAAEDGWTAGPTLAFGGASIALLAGFVLRLQTARNPPSMPMACHKPPGSIWGLPGCAGSELMTR